LASGYQRHNYEYTSRFYYRGYLFDLEVSTEP
jgi:hypothetical protein